MHSEIYYCIKDLSKCGSRLNAPTWASRPVQHGIFFDCSDMVQAPPMDNFDHYTMGGGLKVDRKTDDFLKNVVLLAVINVVLPAYWGNLLRQVGGRYLPSAESCLINTLQGQYQTARMDKMKERSDSDIVPAQSASFADWAAFLRHLRRGDEVIAVTDVINVQVYSAFSAMIVSEESLIVEFCINVKIPGFLRPGMNSFRDCSTALICWLTRAAIKQAVFLYRHHSRP